MTGPEGVVPVLFPTCQLSPPARVGIANDIAKIQVQARLPPYIQTCEGDLIKPDRIQLLPGLSWGDSRAKQVTPKKDSLALPSSGQVHTAGTRITSSRRGEAGSDRAAKQ